jgi:hypothetical protein
LTFFWLKTMSRKAMTFWAFGFWLTAASAGAAQTSMVIAAAAASALKVRM